MKRLMLAHAAAAFVLATAASAPALAANDIVLIFKGAAVANTQQPPAVPAFTSWCNNACTASVQQPVYDASTGQARGHIYVWTHPFVSAPDGKSFCFDEFIVFALDQGDIYTASNPLGVCGGTIDPALKPATHAPAPAIVVAGGGDGVIVGGTRKYQRWTGTYTDRVFVELTFAPGGSNYYDQLFFKISPD